MGDEGIDAIFLFFPFLHTLFFKKFDRSDTRLIDSFLSQMWGK